MHEKSPYSLEALEVDLEFWEVRKQEPGPVCDLRLAISSNVRTSLFGPLAALSKQQEQLARLERRAREREGKDNGAKERRKEEKSGGDHEAEEWERSSTVVHPVALALFFYFLSRIRRSVFGRLFGDHPASQPLESKAVGSS